MPVTINGVKYMPVPNPAGHCISHHKYLCVFGRHDLRNHCRSVDCANVIFLTETDAMTHRLKYGG